MRGLVGEMRIEVSTNEKAATQGDCLNLLDEHVEGFMAERLHTLGGPPGMLVVVNNVDLSRAVNWTRRTLPSRAEMNLKELCPLCVSKHCGEASLAVVLGRGT